MNTLQLALCTVFLTLTISHAAIVYNHSEVSDRTSSDKDHCDRVIDLYLVLDSSGSISIQAFDQAKAAMKELVSRLEVGPKKVMVTIVNYATTVEVPLELASIPVNEMTIDRIKNHIDRIKRLGSSTATGDALFEVYKRCVTLRKCRDFHLGASRTVIVFTDGHSNTGKPILDIKTDLYHKAKAEIYAVGIDSRINNDELFLIATNERYVRHFENYLELLHEINSITIEACGIPAFIVTNTRVYNEIGVNVYRFYQLDTQELLSKTGSRNNLGGYVEIVAHVKKGNIAVFTSSTNPNPKEGSGRRTQSQTRGGAHYYLEYIEHDVSRLYFSFLGNDQLNEYDFEVKWLDINGNIAGQIG